MRWKAFCSLYVVAAFWEASAASPGNFTNGTSNVSANDLALAVLTDDAGANHTGSPNLLQMSSSRESGFEYHKEPFPPDWRHDGLTVLLASLGLIVAASGGIGGGGILVPLFMLALEFKPKHAIALSNFTILGGAIANTLANARRKHPQRPSEPLIDWDLILAMEPLTIFGAVFGSLLSKILPNFVLTSALVIILSLIGQRTLMKGCSMFREESRTLRPVEFELSDRVALAQASDVQDYIEFQSDSELAHGARGSRLRCKIAALTLCFAGTCALTLLKGGGRMASPLGVECGSIGFWLLYFGAVPWVLAFALGFRQMLVSEFHQKLQQGYTFQPGEVRWDSRNTLLYPLLCAIAGLLAGLFGVGGGIVKGPLMLEMGIMPSVASASAAAMILYTSAAASASFLVFGLLHPLYGALFFFLGLICTALGQYVVGQWVHKQNRQSPIVLSIGTVILLSSVFVAINTVVISIGRTRAELLAFHGVCDSAA
ncbi:Sulfite exporter TauE/SafE family protein 2 [Durusdinium trenchii]|uniref:Sulfite exporter TauE/SafE family protein 2 n=1 Tax=Durusdinium trenchii TaxID=1381693 RepID=A0ABP0QGK4_9DINO